MVAAVAGALLAGPLPIAGVMAGAAATIAWVALWPPSVEGVARVGAVDLREGLRVPPLGAVPAWGFCGCGSRRDNT